MIWLLTMSYKFTMNNKIILFKENKQHQSDLIKISKSIKKAKNIVVITHVHADGDALGSSLGLAATLKKLGKNVAVCLEEPISLSLKHLPNQNLIKSMEDLDKDKIDLVIAVDTAIKEILGSRSVLMELGKPTINIDHHNINKRYAKQNLVIPHAPATSEIIYHVVKRLTGKKIPDFDTSTCLYTGIVSDSLGFKIDRVTPNTHEVTANLLKSGINGSDIIRSLMDIDPLERMKLRAMVIDNIELYHGGKIASSLLTSEMFQKCHVLFGEAKGMSNFLLNIKGVDATFLLLPLNDGRIICSLRSNKCYIDVSKIANEIETTGGGHTLAAAFTKLNTNNEEVKKLVIGAISKRIKDHELNLAE